MWGEPSDKRHYIFEHREHIRFIYKAFSCHPFLRI